MNHKAWLDNEYSLWAEALKASTVHNFREHPQVKRMLGEVDISKIDIAPYDKPKVSYAFLKNWDPLMKIQNIGYLEHKYELSGAFVRTVYWALKVLEQNPKSICEIGGGVGEFYAILRALGYEGFYYIYDLPAVKQFQYTFLWEVEKLTGLNTIQPGSISSLESVFCVSFYALGEFDDELKQWYIENVVNRCPHGLIVWNPHSNASTEINFDHEISIEDLADGTKKITW